MSVELRDRNGALSLSGRVAVVTGAGSGIGLALSRRLGLAGARVLMADLAEDRLGQAVSGLRDIGLDADGVTMDVSDAGSLECLAERAFSAGPVAVICLNAGVPGPLGEPTWGLDLAEWEPVIRVNLWAPIAGSNVFVRRLVEQAAPSHLFFTISQAGLWTSPASAPYFTTKHAVYALATILRDQLATSPVRVSAICPGAVQTPLLESIREQYRQAAENGTLPEDGRIDPKRRTLSTSIIAKAVADTVGTTRFNVLTNPEYRRFYEEHVGKVLDEWPAALPAGSVLVQVDRLVAAFESASAGDVVACFRADAGQGDAEPTGLARVPLPELPAFARRFALDARTAALDDGRVEVRWRAIERDSGEVTGTGVDVFTGDTDGIWTAASTNPLGEGMRFATPGDKPGDKEVS